MARYDSHAQCRRYTNDWLSVGEEVKDGRDIKNLLVEDLDDWLAEGKEDTLEISAPQLQAGKELA